MSSAGQRSAGDARAAHGQATVELALGITLFFSVLLIGVYFAEVGVLQLKVHEAANFALFQGTGQRVHHFVGDSDQDGNATYADDTDFASRMGTYSGLRYDDWDGRNGVDNGPWTMAFTQAGTMSVDCDDNGPTTFTVPASASGGDGDFPAVRAKVRDYYQDRGHPQCWAQAQIWSIRIPQQFMEKGRGGFYKRPHWNLAPWTVCGVGRANSGNCSGKFAMLVGDWSLDGVPSDRNNASKLYARDSSDNDNYNDLVRELWNANEGSRGDAASRFATQFGSTNNKSPYDETRYYMSYAGWDDWYTDFTVDHSKPRDTGGIYNDQDRGYCYLGQDGC